MGDEGNEYVVGSTRSEDRREAPQEDNDGESTPTVQRDTKINEWTTSLDILMTNAATRAIATDDEIKLSAKSKNTHLAEEAILIIVKKGC